jgi:putative oxidoreductase
VKTDEVLSLVGRLFLAIIFLAAAFGKITNFDGTVQYMQAHGMPASPFLCAAAIAVEGLGAVSMILGYRTRWGAAALAAFLVVATWIFHTAPDQRIQLLKNLAILGGLLNVMAFGPGPISLEGPGGRA